MIEGALSASTLSADNLISKIFECFSRVHDPRSEKKNTSPIVEHLMAGLAVFGLKFPSLLSYDRGRKDLVIEKNLNTLYHVENAPSDTYLRERLDEVDPKEIRPAFKKIFAIFQRAKGLEQFVFMEDHYLLAIDGTGHFSSGKICCPQCCTKKHADGTVTYYHQMLGACLVHPDVDAVLPLCPEPIQNEDGNEKNDCERSAAKRLIENFRREHPHLKVIVIEDGLSSNAPHVKMLEENDIRYILGAKPGDHEFLFSFAEQSEDTSYHEYVDAKGILHQFHYLNGAPLNKSNHDVKVNFFEYEETKPSGETKRFSWVTNIKITASNIYDLMRGGRARWRIENETFNTLKTYGDYNFEHNYGHGKKNLNTNFGLLAMLSFAIDQIQKMGCRLFQAVKKKQGSYRDCWTAMRGAFLLLPMPSWEVFFLLLSKQIDLDWTLKKKT